MKAVVFDNIGLPDVVLELRDVPVPNIRDDEALVRMVAAALSPGDFIFVQSLYPEPKKPKLPGQIAGTGGGVGYVVEAGTACALEPGTLVAFGYLAAWAEYAAVPSEWLVPLPWDFPIEVAAQLNNAITAWDLLRVVDVRAGGWLGVTAGYSAVSTMLVAFARTRDINVLAFVRSLRHDVDLEAIRVIELPADARDLREQVAVITENRGLHAIVDSVGGPVTGELIRSAAFGARVILYGGMSPEPFTLHNFDVGLKDLKIGTYVYRYFFVPPGRARDEDLATILEAAKHLRPTIGGRHRLDDFAAAVRETNVNASQGKRLFVMGDSSPSSATEYPTT